MALQSRRLLFGMAVFLGGMAGWAAPALVLEPTVFDWGRQTENKGEYPFTFVVKNAGDQELEITRVRAGCSCTKVDLKKDKLAPGESTEMTGVLTTKGIEGPVQKGIILTSNDPVHQTTIANLTIRFPINGEGLRIRGNPVWARLRDGALWAFAVVENCEPQTPIKVEAMELPEGWDSKQTLPVVVAPEERQTLVLVRNVAEDAAATPFDGLPFTLVTDCPKTPRVSGTLNYRPETFGAAAGTAAPQGEAPKVRWPMARPAGLTPAPVTAPAADATPAPAAVPAP